MIRCLSNWTIVQKPRLNNRKKLIRIGSRLSQAIKELVTKFNLPLRYGHLRSAS